MVLARRATATCSTSTPSASGSGATSFVVAYAVRVGDRLCCAVRTTYVLVGADGRPVPVPDDLRAAWQA